MPTNDYPMALSAPRSSVNAIDENLVSNAVAASRKSSRGRMILPLHKQGDNLLQRMLNALQPGSYIRPHRHAVDRGESLIVLRGTLLYLVFNDRGKVEEVLRLEAGTAQFGVDIVGGIWHCFMALESDTVLFEVKPGPYDVEADKEFAPWAPEEYAPEAADYLEGLLQYSTTSR